MPERPKQPRQNVENLDTKRSVNQLKTVIDTVQAFLSENDKIDEAMGRYVGMQMAGGEPEIRDAAIFKAETELQDRLKQASDLYQRIENMRQADPMQGIESERQEAIRCSSDILESLTRLKGLLS